MVIGVRIAMDNQSKLCSSCVYWQRDENRYNRAIDSDENPATLEPWESEDERKAWFPFEVRYCKHPKLLFYQRPERNGASVFDGSDYLAYLATGPEYGCVNHLAQHESG